MESGCAAAVEALPLPLRDPSGHVWQPMKDPKTGRDTLPWLVQLDQPRAAEDCLEATARLHSRERALR
jgi:hypothetical protein